MKLFRLCCCLILAFFPYLTLANWVDFQRHDGIAYFLFSSPAKVSRYNLSTEQFLGDLDFSNLGTATTFEVDGDGIYIAFERNLSRFDLNGENRKNLSNAPSDITDVVTSEFNAYGYYQDNLISVKKADDQINGTEDYFYSMKGLSYSKKKDRLFARNSGVSPSDIVYIDLPDNGSQPTNFFAQIDSPYHGDFPNASKTYLFPNEERVVDDAGIIYTTDSLTFVGSFGGGFDHIDFFSGLPILLRENSILAFNAANIETGSANLATNQNIKNIAVFGEKVFSFSPNTDPEIEVVKTAISDLNTAEPGEPVDPDGLEYEADKIIAGLDGIVYLLSASNLSVFRWSISMQEYLPTIPLRSVPKYMALSNTNRTLYLAYSSGSITSVDLEGDLLEEGFVNLPTEPLGLETAGQYIFAADSTGAGISHWTFSKIGETIDRKDFNYRSREYIWNSQNRRFYHFRDGISPNDLHWEQINTDGTIGAGGDSPFHSSSGINYPIRVSPSGNRVILGSGRIFDGITLNFVTSLSNDIEDAVWYGKRLYTLIDRSSDTSFQVWNPDENFDLEEQSIYVGKPLRLFSTVSNSLRSFLLITEIGGKPNFTLLASDFDLDGITDNEDNCIEKNNPDQADEDENGVGDLCEPEEDDLLMEIVPVLAAIAKKNKDRKKPVELDTSEE